MNVLLINGSPHKAGCTFTALSEVAAGLERNGVETTLFQLGPRAVRGCVACGACATADRCIFHDEAYDELLPLLDAADGVVLGSPVYYAGPNGMLCALLDRLFYSAGGRLRGKPGAAVVSCRRGGASAAFDRLNKYFTINEMPVVASRYWNSVHGNTPEQVRQDLEGLLVMRTLGDNMAWLLKSMAAGGVERPARESGVYTNFIR